GIRPFVAPSENAVAKMSTYPNPADTDPSQIEFIRRLFERYVPEIAAGMVEIKAVARLPGHRTKVAVNSTNTEVNAVRACVGPGLTGPGALSVGDALQVAQHRGPAQLQLDSPVRKIVDELDGERLDIIHWHNEITILVANALAPADVEKVLPAAVLGRVLAIVRDDQLAAAIGRDGGN